MFVIPDEKLSRWLGWIDWCIPKEIEEHHRIQLTQARTVVGLAYAGLLLTSLVLIFQYHKLFLIDRIVLSSLYTVWLLTPFVLRWRKRLFVPAIMSIGTALTMTFYSATRLGGMDAYVMSWLVLLPFLVTIVFESRAGLWTTIITILSLVILLVLDLNGLVLQPVLSKTTITYLEFAHLSMGIAFCYGLGLGYEQIIGRKKLQLQRSERHFRSLVERTQDLIFTLDREAKVVYAAPSMVALFGDVVGLDICDIFSKADPGDCHETLFRVFDTPAKQEHLTFHHILADDTKLIFECWMQNLFDEPDIQGCLCVARDVTERYRLQALQRERDIAESANRSKTMFLANVSHELRTPLNAVIGYSELLQEQAEDRGEDNLSKDLGRIHSSAHTLLALINELLDLSKIEAGKLEIVAEEFDIEDLLREVVDTVDPLMQKNANHFKLIPISGVKMYTDRLRLRQVLLNLLSNASKFAQNKPVRLIACHDDKIHQVYFQVEDEGIGIPPEKLDKIFDSYTQADDDTSHRFGGTGLGLSITRQLCEMMNGTLTVRSELGKGSKFRIQLPMRYHQCSSAKGTSSTNS
ncbi:MAG TPA: hypothetical protein DCE42_03525 [Myxococcales bacterium]|nr:hypothetical protein [Deltaproteobacteria bacterium]MBU49207.1 hypothetical protein [Deltaproteobacteria bacterium]HAA53794.1 hypothetical protein [Myxococcales bacterium]|tara:strand:- start:14711 stop:16444 length:1734 start_codon:yes stop_codon:yes gene_type:complete